MGFVELAELPRWLPTVALVGVLAVVVGVAWLLFAERSVLRPFWLTLFGLVVCAATIVPMSSLQRSNVHDRDGAVLSQIVSTYGVDVDVAALEYPAVRPSDPVMLGSSVATSRSSGEVVTVMLVWDGERMLLQAVGQELLHAR